jgi:hypothetical protein
MHALSLAYSNAQKQSSWIDDPFEGFVTGVTPLSHQRTLEDYIQELVSSRGVYRQDHYELSLNMLADDEQDELVRLYIESIDREIEWACYGLDESINSDFLCDMLSMLKNNDEESRQKFAQTTRKNLLSYYAKQLDELIVTGCDTYYNAEMNEAGYRAEFDLNHGDFQWRKY